MHPKLIVPLHFVCKRLEVLNQLALLRWSGGGPASEGQEATETQPVTRPAARHSYRSRWRSDTTDELTNRESVRLILS